MIVCILSLVCLYFLILHMICRITCGMSDSVTFLGGKTAIVTGGNSGIGFSVALMLASRGCKVIIADKIQDNTLTSRIFEKTGNPNVILKPLDLSSFQSVRNFAEDINKTEAKIDILINNAGISSGSNQYTSDGLNNVMQVNYFGPFLLTHLLLDVLKKSESGRIVFTSSTLSFLHNLSLKNLNYEENHKQNMYVMNQIYANSKLCTIIASDIFADKLKSSNVTSNAVHPGTVRTNVTDTAFANLGFPLLLNCIHVPYSLVTGKDTFEGAQTTFHVATSKKLANVTGRFFVDCTQFFKPRMAYDQQKCMEIWKATEEFIKLHSEEKII